MKFWDASAIVPLLMTEATTRAVQTLAAKDAAMLVWWLASAARKEGFVVIEVPSAE